MALWLVAVALLVTNPLQVSWATWVSVLRTFGAKIDRDVIIRPEVRVEFPWKLRIGVRSWIGEGVWFHNQNWLTVCAEAALSQKTLITPGNHRTRTDMGPSTRPLVIEDAS